jgi:hypothetical protein
MAVTARSAALAAIGEGERTQRGTVLGASRHRCLQKADLDFGFVGKPRGDEA